MIRKSIEWKLYSDYLIELETIPNSYFLAIPVSSFVIYTNMRRMEMGFR